MKQFLLVLLVASIITSCANDKKEKSAEIIKTVVVDSTLITDSSWGPITKKSTIADLIQIFGAASVVDERVCGPECADSIDITKVYPETEKEFIVNWVDSFYHKNISFIECWNPASPYHTSTGLKMGSTLQDLLKVNGQKMTFSGFGWDYGGYVQSYNNGTLEKSPINFRLEHPDNSTDKLWGDTTLSSDSPEVQKAANKIIVWHLSLSFTERN